VRRTRRLQLSIDVSRAQAAAGGIIIIIIIIDIFRVA